MIQDLITPVVDYKAVFARFPGAALILTPGFRILDMSDGAVELSGRKRQDLVGRGIFDAFPANPRGRGATGQRVLREALARAASGESVAINLNEYDLEDPGRPGVFEERFWSGVAAPILDDDGRVAMIALWGHDTTPIVSQAWARASALG